MNGYNFSQGVRQALARAREEAARLHHEFVGTEHELLGLLVVKPNLATEVLERHNIALSELRDRIESAGEGGEVHVTGSDLPYTSRAKKALELAMTEARYLNHSEVNCGHLLLGLLRERRGLAGSVLNDMGVTEDSARANFVDLVALGQRDPGAGVDSMPDLTGQAAALFLQAMAASPSIAAVFAKHEIDLPTLIDDVRKAR